MIWNMPNPSFSGGRLPEGYTEVEYIESSGTAYLDTGITPTSGFLMELDFSFTSGADKGLFGRDTTPTISMFTGSYGDLTKWGYRFNSTDGTITAPSSGRHTLKVTISAYMMDSTIIKSSGFTSTGGGSLVLGNAYTNTGGQPQKIYSYKAWQGSTALCELVPCISPDSVVGMYDLVREQFYSGNGNFQAGSPI